MRGKRHDEETKARALALLMSGHSVAHVAGQMRLSDATVRTWAKSLGDEFAKLREKKGESLTGLLETYVTASLESQIEQVRAMADPAWLKKQNARQLAILYGVLTDKTFRVMELL